MTELNDQEQAMLGHRYRVMWVVAGVVVLLVIAAALAGCGGGSSGPNWYQNGAAYAAAADQAGETSDAPAASAAGDFCWYTYQDKNSSAQQVDMDGIPMHSPPGNDASSGAGAQWVAGCNSDPTADNAGVGQ